MGKYTEMTDGLYDYLQSLTVHEDKTLAECRQETAALENARMQIAPEQGQLLALLASLVASDQGTEISAIEVGTFTGYSAMCIARALMPGQKLVTCDLNEETIRMAERFFVNAGLDQRIDVAVGPAGATLSDFEMQGMVDDVDFMFIDADKSNYDLYYEFGLRLVRPGGLIAIDNVFWGGDVLDPKIIDEDTEAIRALNAKISSDRRVFASTIPIADGLTVCRKL